MNHSQYGMKNDTNGNKPLWQPHQTSQTPYGGANPGVAGGYAAGQQQYHAPNTVQPQRQPVSQTYQQPYVPPQPPKRKRGAGFWVALILAIVAIGVAAFFAYQYLSPQGSVRDPNQASGQLEGKTPEEIQAELNRVVEEGMFNISIASVVEFADGTAPGEVRIENVPGNRYLMQVTIALDDTGQTVYTSGIIEPDHHIQSAPLDVDLDAGQYAATATFAALDPETEEEIGQAAARITLNVLS